MTCNSGHPTTIGWGRSSAWGVSAFGELRGRDRGRDYNTRGVDNAARVNNVARVLLGRSHKLADAAIAATADFKR